MTTPPYLRLEKLWRLRCFLNLRQIDVERATGINVGRLSAAERGQITLTQGEEHALGQFLGDRLKTLQESFANQGQGQDPETSASGVTQNRPMRVT